jgi:ABC-2 type transport system permease protein
MKRFLSILKISILEKLEYRSEFISTVLLELASLVLQMFLWKLIISESGSVAGYNYEKILAYYVLTKIFDTLSLGGRKIFKTFLKHIAKGDLSNNLIKPFSTKAYYIIQGLGYQIVSSFIQSLILILFLMIDSSVRGILYINPTTIAYILIYIVLITVFNLIFHLCFSTIGFWTTSGNGIRVMLMITTRILKGSLFPIDIAPMWFVNLMKILPFMYTGFFPAKLLLGSIETKDVLWGIINLSIYSVIFFILTKILWKKGLKVYDSVGK